MSRVISKILAPFSRAVLTFTLSTDHLVSLVDSLLASNERNYHSRSLEEAQDVLLCAKSLAGYLQDRILSKVSRLSTSILTISVCRD